MEDGKRGGNDEKKEGGSNNEARMNDTRKKGEKQE